MYCQFECWIALGACAKNSFVSLIRLSPFGYYEYNSMVFLYKEMYIVKCDGDVHVERFGILCNVVQCICFTLL